MGTRRYVRHSTEFKVRLVQSYLAGEGTIKGLARQHGIYHSLFRLWIKQYRKGHFDEKDAVVGKVEGYEAKIAALERKVGQLTMEIDFLFYISRTAKKVIRVGLDPIFFVSRSPLKPWAPSSFRICSGEYRVRPYLLCRMR
jgi:transposase